MEMISYAMRVVDVFIIILCVSLWPSHLRVITIHLCCWFSQQSLQNDELASDCQNRALVVDFCPHFFLFSVFSLQTMDRQLTNLYLVLSREKKIKENQRFPTNSWNRLDFQRPTASKLSSCSTRASSPSCGMMLMISGHKMRWHENI